MKDIKYIVVSHENNCVYTYTPRELTAIAIAEGEPDCVAMAVNPLSMPDYKNIVNRNYFYDNVWAIDITKTNKLTKVEDVSDAWLQKRELIRARQDVFYHWEATTVSALNRLNTRAWKDFDVVAYNEILKCNPDADEYTWMVQEYAKINERQVEDVYKELKLKIETDNIKRFRIQAMSDRWKTIINSTTEIEHLRQLKQQLLTDYWFKSHI